MTMKALRGRISKFSIDAFFSLQTPPVEAPGVLVLPVGVGEKSSDLGDGVGRD
jgi:hypothetical protein